MTHFSYKRQWKYRNYEIQKPIWIILICSFRGRKCSCYKIGNFVVDKSSTTSNLTFKTIRHNQNSFIWRFKSDVIDDLMTFIPRIQSFFVWIVVNHCVPLKFICEGNINIFISILNLIQNFPNLTFSLAFISLLQWIQKVKIGESDFVWAAETYWGLRQPRKLRLIAILVLVFTSQKQKYI